MKTHWLYGSGPNKELKFKHEVDEETDCSTCIHNKVCSHNMEKRCSNFDFARSDRHPGCDLCLHRFTRYDKDPVPCFHCPDYLPSQGAP